MKCPYCKSEVNLKIDSTFIYGRNYGTVYCCSNYPSCNSYVGVHKNTIKPLGTIANKELRELRTTAHIYFDTIWKCKRNRGFKNARTLGYEWLSEQMGKDFKKTHIGMFNNSECEKVIKICKPYYIKIKYK